MIKQIGESITALIEGQAIVTESAAVSDDIGKIKNVNYGADATAKIQSWGSSNSTPADREKLVADNNITPSLIATKRDITLGQELYAFKKKYIDGKKVIEEVEIPEEVINFFDQSGKNGGMGMDDYFRNAANELIFHSNVFSELLRDKSGSAKIGSIKVLKCKHTRAEEMDTKGKINHYYWCGNWNPTGRRSDKYPVQAIKAYNYNEDKKQAKFLLHTGDDMLNIDGYYNTPFWWGAKAWIELANCIPDFHQSNLKHGYNIRYNIEIPKGYFSQFTSNQNTQSDRTEAAKKESTAKAEFLRRLNDFLAGVNNSGRALVTEYELNKSMGKEFPGIKVTPLKVNLQDSALLELFEKSNQANVSAQGIHPTLANIETQGKLSSGSEIRNAFLLYVAIKTPLPRKILLKPLYLIKQINGWDKDIYFGFKDIVLQTLDENKTATAEKNIT